MLAQQCVVCRFAGSAVVEFDESTVILFLVPAQASNGAKLAKELLELLILESALCMLKQDEQSSLVLVALASF